MVQERATFMSMIRGVGQSDADFLIAVEAERRVIMPNEPTSNLPFIFIPKLTQAYVDKLQFARASKILNNPHSDVSLTWEDIVLVAKDEKYSVKLVGERN
jgi:hypothetical protein